MSKTEEADLSAAVLKLYLNGLKHNLAFLKTTSVWDVVGVVLILSRWMEQVSL